MALLSFSPVENVGGAVAGRVRYRNIPDLKGTKWGKHQAQPTRSGRVSAF